VLHKIRALRAELSRRGRSTIVESDGGINERTIAEFAAAGLDAFVVGSALFGAADYGSAFARLRAEVERGVKTAEAR
jgi:ribulose-phosphate 3-epimerase